jgi:hypothetical protein
MSMLVEAVFAELPTSFACLAASKVVNLGSFFLLSYKPGLMKLPFKSMNQGYPYIVTSM